MERLFILAALLSFISVTVSQKEKALEFLKSYENMIPFIANVTEASWREATNITDYNSNFKIKMELEFTDVMRRLRKQGSAIDLTDAEPDTRRQIKMLLNTKTSTNNSVEEQLLKVGTKMANIYNTGTIPYDADIIKSLTVGKQVKTLRLNKHLHHIMATSDNTDELLYVWKSWRDSVGPQAKDLYTEYVRLNNIGAREHGFLDAGEYKRSTYEVDNLEMLAESFLKDMQSFYVEIHGYVRYRLSKVYPGIVKEDSLIPAHVFGNMWAQGWGNIYRYLVPYPNEPPLDITPVLKEKLTVNEMFLMAEKFFISIGWEALPQKFWTHSMFVEPKDRDVDCHASAWEFMEKDNGEPDVRVKMCTQPTQRDFATIHHELGHTYYQLLYWNQPLIYRGGANPGFHEAVGDIMGLSVETPTHLAKVGLIKSVSTTDEADINFLLKSALGGIVFLPFAFLMDKWMWNVYNGNIKPDQYNAKWWEYRMMYQGIKAPIERNESDFDPGAKMHIAHDVSYIRYFFAGILQYIFHDKACKVAKHPGPLHQCSIYKSKEAGKGLADMLALGKSKPWPEVLEQYTGSKDISTEPIKKYYQPLIMWLRKYRSQKQYKLGWDTMFPIE